MESLLRAFALFQGFSLFPRSIAHVQQYLGSGNTAAKTATATAAV